MTRSRLDSCPIDAQQSKGNLRISVDRNLIVAYSASFVMTTAKVPAARINWPPAPGRNSILCTMEPAGMERKGRQLPGTMFAFSLDITVSPGRSVNGARM